MPSEVSWLLRDSVSVVFRVLAESTEYRRKLELSRLIAWIERDGFPELGQGFVRLSELSQNEPELIASLEIFRSFGDSKFKFRLRLGVITQTSIDHTEQDVP